MARRKSEKPEHLGQGQKKPHRAHRVAVAVAACAVVAGLCAGGYAAWQQGQTAQIAANSASNGATETQGGVATGDASAGADDAQTAQNDNGAAAASAQSGAADADENADSSNGNASPDGSDSSAESESDDQQPQRQVGQHDAPTAEQQASMAAIKQQLTVSGAPAGFADSTGYQELLYQLAVWQGEGHDLGFILTDLGSGATVSYNTDQVFYPASSVKGPFVCSLYEEVAEKGGDEATLDSLAAKTIEDSDNDAFRQLHQTFGESAFLTWLSDAGVPATAGQSFGYFSQYYYPHISCAQLNLMWSQIYRYCSSGTAPSKVLAGYFASRTTSPIAEAVGSRETSWGKAGWYYSSGDYGAEPATVDAGIVFADKGPYQVVMMSSAPGQLDQMAELAYGMDQAAADLAE